METQGHQGGQVASWGEIGVDSRGESGASLGSLVLLFSFVLATAWEEWRSRMSGVLPPRLPKRHLENSASRIRDSGTPEPLLTEIYGWEEKWVTLRYPATLPGWSQLGRQGPRVWSSQAQEAQLLPLSPGQGLLESFPLRPAVSPASHPAMLCHGPQCQRMRQSSCLLTGLSPGELWLAVWTPSRRLAEVPASGGLRSGRKFRGGPGPSTSLPGGEGRSGGWAG